VFLTAVIVAVLRGLAGEEARGWLDQLPEILIRLAARRIPREHPKEFRDDLAAEWADVLRGVLRDDQGRPVTRLYLGVRCALGFLRTAPSVSRGLSVAESLSLLLVTYPGDPLDPAELSDCAALHPRAQVLLEQAREHNVETPERADLLIATARFHLRARNNLMPALELHREAAAVRELLYRRGELGTAEFADGYHNLAYNLRELGEFRQAAALDEQVLRIRRNLPADDGNTEHLARSLTSLASDLRGLGDAARARPLDEEALQIRRGLRRRGHLPDDRYTARSLSNLADDLRMLGDLEQARRLAVEGLFMSTDLFGGDHPEIALSLDALAAIYHRLGNGPRADQCEANALAMRQRLLSRWR
jgi:tetratricopeptide (TPR) repeat protein